LVILSQEDLPIEQASTKEDRKALFLQRVEEASQLVQELKESGITETQDLIRELRNRFPANVVSKVLGVSGRELKAPRNADLRVEEAANSTILNVLTEQAKQLSQTNLERWFKLGKLLESMDLEERARMHSLHSVEEYVRNALNFYDCFENLVLNLRFGSVVAQ
jgi:hypothetical protein